MWPTPGFYVQYFKAPLNCPPQLPGCTDHSASQKKTKPCGHGILSLFLLLSGMLCFFPTVPFRPGRGEAQPVLTDRLDLGCVFTFTSCAVATLEIILMEVRLSLPCQRLVTWPHTGWQSPNVKLPTGNVASRLGSFLILEVWGKPEPLSCLTYHPLWFWWAVLPLWASRGWYYDRAQFHWLVMVAPRLPVWGKANPPQPQ